MSNTQSGADAPLNDVMLAMDVVDTLRHQQTIVQRELNEEEREQALIVRLRDIYAGQGIDVPDEVLAEGVAALKEDRFTYKPSPPSFGRTLANFYVNRGYWGKLTGSLAALTAVVYVGYLAFVTWPEARRTEQAATAQVQSLQSAKMKLDELRRRHGALSTQTAAIENDVPSELKDTAVGLVDRATRELSLVEADLAGVSVPERPRQYDPVLDDAIQQTDAALASIEAALGSVESQLSMVRSLARLDQELPSKQRAVLKISKDPRADARANAILEAGRGALLSGDVEGAMGAAQELDALLRQLNLRYELRILNREGQQSGVFRIPPNNSSAQNYYLIVEAVDRQGRPVAVSVADEELGQTVNANIFGMRVSEQVFRRVARDKQDDGIIQESRFGEKRLGYLTPDYEIPTTGGSITRW